MNIVQYIIIDNIVMSRATDQAEQNETTTEQAAQGIRGSGNSRGKDDERSALIHE